MTGISDCHDNNVQILVVEDDDFSEQISSTLEQEGYPTLTVGSGRNALDWLSANSPRLILLNYSLQDMEGADLIEQIWELGCQIPFIVVAGADDASLAVEMIKTGACDYVVKDGSFLERLPLVVTRVLHEIETRERLERVKQLLRLSESRLARAQRIARMGSWELDLRNGNIYLSDEFYRIVGIMQTDAEQVSIRMILGCINQQDLPLLKRNFFQAVKNGQSFNTVCRIKSRLNGEAIVNIHGEPEFGDDGKTCLISGTTLDITDRIKAECEIQQLINYDTLTGLPNRNLLHERITHSIAKAAPLKQIVGLLFIDLDRLKNVNETLGHRAGDYLLKSVAKRLLGCIRDSDTLARLGSDEFVIVMNSVTNEEGLSNAAKKILSIIAEPFDGDDDEIYITATIGISVYPLDGDDGHLLLKHADLAMYQAKELSRNSFNFFSQEMNSKALERLMLENSMRKALEREEFFLVYQPQVDVRNGKIVGMEALLRWQHPDMGLLGPDRFICLAEETGFIVPLGEWVLQKACRQNKAWQMAGLPPVRVAVNLSARQFGQQRLDETISSILFETGLAPEWLELEITESAIMKNADGNIDMLRKLKEMGIALAVDDFGTGYSSLSYLKHFPISRLKIDRSFVRDITTNSDDAAIAEIIIAMSQMLKLNVIAEGVETRAQMGFLSFHNCVEMQGYLFSRPVLAEQFAEMLKNGLKY